MVPPNHAIKIEESNKTNFKDSPRNVFRGSPSLVLGTNKRKQASPLSKLVKQEPEKQVQDQSNTEASKPKTFEFAAKMTAIL